MTTDGVDEESCTSSTASDNTRSNDLVCRSADGEAPDEIMSEGVITSDDDGINLSDSDSDGDDCTPNQSNGDIMSDDLNEEKNRTIRYQYAYDPSESKALFPLFFPFGRSSDRQQEYDHKSTETDELRKQRVEIATIKLRQLFKKYAAADALPPLNLDDWKGEECPRWEIDPSSPWYDVPAALDEIVQVREELRKAWNSDDENDQDKIDSNTGQDVCINHDDREWKTTNEQSWKNRDSSSNAFNSNDKPLTMNEWYIQSHKEQEEKRYKEQNPPLTKDEQEKFKQFHMEWVTDAFAEELDALRKGRLEKMFMNKSKNSDRTSNPLELDLDPTQHSFVVPRSNISSEKNEESDKAVEEAAAAEVDVRVLADMLMSGENFLSDVEKRMLVNARLRGQMDNGKSIEGKTRGGGMSLHEQRRRELGFCE
ncbi:hypothetical protein ACHAXS_007094 [Conticribra weissflogii]